VNDGIVMKVLGNLLILESLFMLPPLAIAIYLKQSDIFAFVVSIVLISVIGYFMSSINAKKEKIRVKEGLAIVALGWLVFSFFGALPFVFSGSIPSFIDAFFETVSGFTTTGATILNDIESLPKGILFWRSFTHWIGGMGILVFTLALLPILGIGGFQILKAESPGPVTDKIAPKVKDTAKVLYITYITITISEILLLMFGGMSLYEATLHTFGTVGTGGFSPRSLSIGAYNSTYIHVVISIFMILSGVNFSLYFAIYHGKWKDAIKDGELKLYLLFVSISTVLIGINLNFVGDTNIFIALRDALFQVSSIITTTGYATVDFDQWTTFSKTILFLLMFVGASAGSTGGGIKNIRILVLLKMIKREIVKIFHPRAMVPVKVNNKIITNDTVSGIISFFALYILLFVVGTIIISLEGIDIESAASSVAATLGNVGPGFGFVGATQTYSEFSNFSKLVFSLLMLLGRLELFTFVVFIVPKSWRHEF